MTDSIALFLASLAIFIFGWIAGYKASQIKVAEQVAFTCRGVQ